MSARVQGGGASAPSSRLALIDWISLAVFLSPLAIAAANSIAGGF